MYVDTLCVLVGMSAVLLAIDCDYSECVRELLYAGANPDGPLTAWQQAPLMSGYEDCELQPARTPLVSAMLNNSLSSLRLLLQAGCRLDIASRVNDVTDPTGTGGALMMSAAELLEQCTLNVQRIVFTAASALALQVPAHRVYITSYRRLARRLDNSTIHTGAMMMMMMMMMIEHSLD